MCLNLLVSNTCICISICEFANVLNAFYMYMFSVLHLLKNQPPLTGDQLQGMAISMQDFQVKKSCLTELKLKSYTNSSTSFVIINCAISYQQFSIDDAVCY